MGWLTDWIPQEISKPFSDLISKPIEGLVSSILPGEVKSAIPNEFKTPELPAMLAMAAAAPWAFESLSPWLSSVLGTEGAAAGAGGAASGSVLTGAPAPMMDTLATSMPLGNMAPPGISAATTGAPFGAGELAGGAGNFLPATTTPGVVSPSEEGKGFLSDVYGTVKNSSYNPSNWFSADTAGPPTLSPGSPSLVEASMANVPGVAGLPAAPSGSWMSSLKGSWPSMLGGTGTGMQSWMLPLMGAGLGSDFLTSFQRADQEKKDKEALAAATQGYVDQTTWNPAKRGEYMKGVQSELQTMLGGAKKRAGAAGAASGTGGAPGLNKAYSDAMSTAAKQLYGTYAPSSLPIGVLEATAKSQSQTPGGGQRFLSDLSNLAGGAGTNMLTWSMMKDILGK